MKVLESPSFVYKNLPNENLFELRLLGFFVLDDDHRKIHCPDCMFHSNYDLPKFGKLDLFGMARRLILTEIQIKDENFHYSCNEAGISCAELWGRNYKNGK